MCMGCTQFVEILLLVGGVGGGRWAYIQKVSLELSVKMLGHRVVCVLQSMTADVTELIPQLFVLILCFLAFFLKDNF